ncbi:MAG: FAD-binding protein [Oscillospiraceae bacterium]|jgi:succinate dehydrogenase/fumarate reductase flavoprotein subunit|nr:FAD-binding protein [Oscillospiraceae bacterium]
MASISKLAQEVPETAANFGEPIKYLNTADEDAQIAKRRDYPWETPPPPIPESEIAETVDTEVVIVGGGISGLAAGARCAQLGLKVIVLEKTGGYVAHGAHLATVGSKVQRANGVFLDKTQFAREWMRTSGSRVNEDLLWIYVNRSEEAFDWLCEMGGDNIDPLLFGAYYRGPVFTEYPGTHIIAKPPNSKYRYKGALLVCEVCEDVIISNDGKVIRKTSAKQLEKKDGRVTAVIAIGEDGKYRRFCGSRGIVLATGDIGSDRDMLEHFAPIGTIPNHDGYFPHGINTGDGHKMGRWAGGEFEPSPWAVSVHLVAYGMYCFHFLHVNRQGNRYMNEDTWVQAKSIRTMMQENGDWAFSVFDADWIEDVSRTAPISGGQFADTMNAEYGKPWLDYADDVKKDIERYIEKGTCVTADTLEELAVKMGVPPDNFAATVARYNEHYKNGADTDYGKRPEMLTSIDKPPYYALKFGPSLLNVFGGFITDTKLHVLGKDRKPVPGLYATGMIAGGLYGVDYPLLFSGNSHGRCLTWALVIGDTLASEQ